MKNFFMRYKGIAAALLCFAAAVTAGYMIQKNEIEKANALEREKAFTAKSSVQEAESEPSVAPPRVLPEAFTDDTASEPIVTEEELSLPTAAENTFSPSMPLPGTVIKGFSSSPLYSVTLDDWRSHEAVDISGAEGDGVFAIEGGTVTAVGRDMLLGVYVRINHNNGMESLYANLHTETTVTEGQTVEAGHQLGYVGKTAVLEQAEVEHLHFELIKDGKKVNPKEYIK